MHSSILDLRSSNVAGASVWSSLKSTWLQARSREKAAVAAWGGARQANALVRDFTVNSLLYDPFDRILYDYTGEQHRPGILHHCPQTFISMAAKHSFHVSIWCSWK